MGVMFVLLALAIAAAYLTFTQEGPTSASAFFSEVLAKEHIEETVRVGIRTFTVRNGDVLARDNYPATQGERLEALRLVYSKSLARRAPLFSLEGTDITRLSRAVGELAGTRELLAETAERPDEALLIRTSLYPIDFLYSVISLEKARRAFLASGSATDEHTYWGALQLTLSGFESNLGRYRRAFTAVVPQEPRAEYLLPFGSITRESILEALDAFAESDAELKERLAQRDSCLRGYTYTCEPLDLRISPPPSGKTTSVSSVIPPLVLEIVSMRSEAVGRARDAQEERIIELSEKTCPPYSAGPYYFVPRQQEETTHGPASFFANDLFFYQSGDFRDSPSAVMMKYFAGKNVSFVFLPTTAFYTCPEIGTDLGLMAAVAGVADFAEKNPGLAPAAEKMLFSNPRIVHEDLARAYVNEALKETRSDSDVVHDLVALTLMFKDRSAGFDMLVGEVAAFGVSDVRMKKAGIPVDITPQYLFLARSGFFALFMGHNHSVVGERDIRVLKEKIGSSDKNVYRWSQMRLQVPREEVIQDLRFFITSHISPETIRGE